MSSPDPNPVRTGVIGTIVGGIALAALAELWPPAKTSLLWAWERVKSFAALFGDDYRTSGWLLALLGVLALITVVRFLAGLRANLAPDYTKFVALPLYGATWHWTWRSGEISNLWCLCPTCQAELVYDDSSVRNIYTHEREHTKFVCETCGGKIVATVDGGDKDYALDAVKREIRRRVRTGEYKRQLASEA